VQKKYGWQLPQIYQACLEEYKKAITLDPKNFDFAADYARTFFFAKYFQVALDYDEAIAAWEYCLSLDIDKGQKAYVLLNMAHISEEAGRPDQMRKYAEEILKIEPTHPAAKLLLERSASPSKNIP
jgi:tetratricopeptide (TPR) repeat protein